MNKRQSLNCLGSGKEAWNAWADKILQEKDSLIQSGLWVCPDANSASNLNSETKNWIERASVDFSGVRFEKDVDFSGFVFPFTATFEGAFFERLACFKGAFFYGVAKFNRVKFNRKALFNGALFSCYAGFYDCTFNDFSGFVGAAFRGHAGFDGAKFLKEAWFYQAMFYLSVRFELVIFENRTVFSEAVFYGEASFKCLDSKTGFDLGGAEFYCIPDFTQAHFLEPPRLDDVTIAPDSFTFSFRGVKNKINEGGRDAAKWRALKKLAIQAHDYSCEHEFFKKELVARRYYPDHPFKAVFWVGLLYQLFSGFGRSIALPFFWLFLSYFVFGFVYMQLSPLSFENYKDMAKPVSCVIGDSDARVSALQLSLSKTPLKASVTQEEFKSSLLCMYGVSEFSEINAPNSLFWLGVFQFVFSSVMFFLVILGVRNNFRIK